MRSVAEKDPLEVPSENTFVYSVGIVILRVESVMTEQVKFVLNRLNEEPFNRNLNLISLDALRPEQLLQLMFDVFAQVDPKTKSDVKTEDAEQLSIKVGLFAERIFFSIDDYYYKRLRFLLRRGQCKCSYYASIMHSHEQALTLLRVIKYKPPSDISLSAFRQGLVTGDKGIIYDILYYVLGKLETHKKRAYLAR